MTAPKKGLPAKKVPAAIVPKPSVIDTSETAVGPTRTFSQVISDSRKSMRETIASSIKTGSWKTPVKVLIVVCLAVGVGVAIALLVQHFA